MAERFVGIRQKINQAPKAGIVVIIVLVVGVYGVVAWELRHPALGSHASIKSYYTIDDGQTYFADDGALMPPFDHDGSPAVRCYVYRSKGTLFVGFLEKYADDLLQTANAPFDPSKRGLVGRTDFKDGTLVKRPGDKEWVKKYSARGEQIQLVKSPDGSDAQPEPVNP
jgi:hypothetical protein